MAKPSADGDRLTSRPRKINRTCASGVSTADHGRNLITPTGHTCDTRNSISAVTALLHQCQLQVACPCGLLCPLSRSLDRGVLEAIETYRSKCTSSDLTKRGGDVHGALSHLCGSFTLFRTIVGKKSFTCSKTQNTLGVRAVSLGGAWDPRAQKKKKTAGRS